MKKYTIKIDVQVDDIWMDDGLDLLDPIWKEEIELALISLIFPYATEDEYKITVKVKS